MLRFICWGWRLTRPRTLFSMPPRAEHSQRKRILADRYANTNIMRPEMIKGLEDRAKLFLEKCLAETDPDVYVSFRSYHKDSRVEEETENGSRYTCTVLRWMEHHSIFSPRTVPTLSQTLQILRSWKKCHTTTVSNVHLFPFLCSAFQR